MDDSQYEFNLSAKDKSSNGSGSISRKTVSTQLKYS